MAAATLTTTADRHTAGDDSIDRSLLARPLEFLFVDHLRQRNLCTLIEQLADAPDLQPELAERLASHIAGDLAIHGIDDEEDLYPLIRRRARPEDRIEEVLGVLSGEHAAQNRLAEAVVGDLRTAAAENQGFPVQLRIRLRLFASRLRRYLAVENAIILPLAEDRLTEADRRGLARRMAARRGLQLDNEAYHA
jgi:hypothetical protein